jgi:hypothetical protein
MSFFALPISCRDISTTWTEGQATEVLLHFKTFDISKNSTTDQAFTWL